MHRATASLELRYKRIMGETPLVTTIVGHFRRGCAIFLRRKSLSNLGRHCDRLLIGGSHRIQVLNTGRRCGTCTLKVGRAKRLVIQGRSKARRTICTKRISIHNMCKCMWPYKWRLQGIGGSLKLYDRYKGCKGMDAICEGYKR